MANNEEAVEEPYTFEDWKQFKDWEEENFGPDPEQFPDEAKAFQVEWSIRKFEEGAKEFQVFRLQTEVNGVVFYSENLTRECMIEKINDDPFWVLSFEGIVEVQAQEAEDIWVQV